MFEKCEIKLFRSHTQVGFSPILKSESSHWKTRNFGIESCLLREPSRLQRMEGLWVFAVGFHLEGKSLVLEKRSSLCQLG